MSIRSKLLLIGIFFIPLKLSFAYIFLIPEILHFIYIKKTSLISEIRNNNFLKYYFLFIISLILSSIFGVPELTINSFSHSIRLLFISLLIPLISFELTSNLKIKNILLTLGTSQAIAAVHSIYQYINPSDKRQFFIGTVTESGQLALIIPILAGIIIKEKKVDYKLLLITLISITLIFIGVNLDIKLISYISLILSIIITIYSIVIKKDFSSLILYCLVALLVNLKRGPTIAVLISTMILTSLYYPIITVIFGILLSICFYCFEPFRERLLAATDHFFITGGRNEIWEIGFHFIKKFPLGIGYDNSRILSNYSLTIPKDLKHFHNNFLNILVELGSLNLLFILVLFYYLFKNLWLNKTIYAISILSSILAILLAGIVEYNLGDSEILIGVLILLGISNYLFKNEKI